MNESATTYASVGCHLKERKLYNEYEKHDEETVENRDGGEWR